MPCLREDKEGRVILTVHVQPKASRDGVAGLHGEAVKVSITAPPVDGKANAALVRFLAKLFGMPKAAVVLDSGHQGRTKRFLLQGLSLAEARQILER
nr:DUF167 family protein [Desulfobacteraceae bacterium]